MTDETHEHKFNPVGFDSAGRCSCGAWAHWHGRKRGYAIVTYLPILKGLENKLARGGEPKVPYPRSEPKTPAPPVEGDLSGDGRKQRHFLTTIYKDE